MVRYIYLEDDDYKTKLNSEKGVIGEMGINGIIMYGKPDKHINIQNTCKYSYNDMAYSGKSVMLIKTYDGIKNVELDHTYYVATNDDENDSIIRYILDIYDKNIPPLTFTQRMRSLFCCFCIPESTEIDVSNFDYKEIKKKSTEEEQKKLDELAEIESGEKSLAEINSVNIGKRKAAIELEEHYLNSINEIRYKYK